METSRAVAESNKDSYVLCEDAAVRAELLSQRWARVRDLLCDLRLRTKCSYWLTTLRVPFLPKCRVLLVTVAVPGRTDHLNRVIQRLASARHTVTTVTVPMQERGKFDNINEGLQEHEPIDNYDWIVASDDDIVIPAGFLDRFLYLANRYDLKIVQPAHRFHSFASFALTKRRWGSLARRTGFVEIGPLTAFHRDTFASLLPFPSLRWGWGLDLYWAEIARRKGWKIGIIDALPIRHYRPVATVYSSDAAVAEARQFLAARGIPIRHEILQEIETYVR